MAPWVAQLVIDNEKEGREREIETERGRGSVRGKDRQRFDEHHRQKGVQDFGIASNMHQLLLLAPGCQTKLSEYNQKELMLP